MSQSEWSELNNSLAAVDVSRGVSQGFTPPNGGGSFVYGYHSLTNTAGAVGKYPNQANFTPAAKGGSIRAAIQRNGGDSQCTMMLAACLADFDVQAEGYLLGFAEDEEPGHLILRKGAPSGGLPEAGADVLRKSSGTYTRGEWAHIRLDVIVQPHGDVHLQVFENADLATNDVTAPDWQSIDGMAEYIDDKLGINSGSVPFNSGGYFGIVYRTLNINRYGLVDHVEIARQL